MDRNFLNLSEKEKDEPIFRVISIKRLFQLFNSQKNVLVKPRLWDDPFENYIMNSTGELPDGKMFTFGFRDNFYGQCWTKTRESDALWRIYSPEKSGVRITTTPRKLLNALYINSDSLRDIRCYLGKVQYYSTPKLKKLMEINGANWTIDQTGAGQAQTLLFKRNAFKYENEIRIIYNSLKENNENLHRFNFEPRDLIDDIVFDPRIDYKIFSKYKKVLKEVGYNKRVVKSNLYKVPNLKFQFEI